MKVTIFGSGYVGLVTGACLAEAGNHVVCPDTSGFPCQDEKHGLENVRRVVFRTMPRWKPVVSSWRQLDLLYGKSSLMIQAPEQRLGKVR